MWRAAPGWGTLVAVLALVLTDLLGFGAVLLVCAGCLFIANRIEPHWVSRDGHRFLTVAQELDQWGLPFGRRREVRARVDDETDTLVITRRSVMRPSQTVWVIDAKSPDPPRGKAVYILKKVTSEPVIGQLALRLPANSRMVPKLDEILAETGAGGST